MDVPQQGCRAYHDQFRARSFIQRLHEFVFDSVQLLHIDKDAWKAGWEPKYAFSPRESEGAARAHRATIAGANLVGSDLYNKLSLYFISHFKGMLEVRFTS